jgi:plastocyanin
MAKIPVLDAIRIIPRDSDFLDRKSGNRGEIFFDLSTNTLRLYNGSTVGGVNLAKADLTNISNATFAAKAATAGVSGGVQTGIAGRIAYYPSNGSQVNDLAELYWHTHDGVSMLHIDGLLEVSGQKNKIRFHWDTLADLTSQVPAVDWHGMIAHAHDTGKLYYAHASAWVPVAAESSLPNTFSTIVIAGQSSVIADTTTDTLTLVAGTGITLATNAGTDTITITGTASTGNITFAGNTIDSADSTAITVTPTVNFESDVVVGNAIVFSDGTYQQTSAVGVPGPTGPIGPTGASGAGSGDVLSAGGGYVDNRIVRYDGATGTIIQVSSASISDVGLLTATSFSGDGSLITALNATELTTGTIPNARFPATLPAASGVNLTALNATQLTSGTVPVLRLGSSGTRDNTTYLRGDNTWATASGGAASDSFATIAVAGQSNVVAESATDTLTMVAGSGISITTDASTDAVTIASTVLAGATEFTGLNDASTASLTVDKIYLPAITMLNVTANGVTAYRFDQYGTDDDPTIYAINGTTIAFNLAGAGGHPFLIQDGAAANYNTGLIHVSTAGVVSTGASAQAKSSGTLYWKIPNSISGAYRYQCQSHPGMVGNISIKNFGSI